MYSLLVLAFLQPPPLGFLKEKKNLVATKLFVIGAICRLPRLGERAPSFVLPSLHHFTSLGFYHILLHRAGET